MNRKTTYVFCVWWAGKKSGTKINVWKILEYQKMSMVKVALKLVSTLQFDFGSEILTLFDDMSSGTYIRKIQNFL